MGMFHPACSQAVLDCRSNAVRSHEDVWQLCGRTSDSPICAIEIFDLGKGGGTCSRR